MNKIARFYVEELNDDPSDKRDIKPEWLVCDRLAGEDIAEVYKADVAYKIADALNAMELI